MGDERERASASARARAAARLPRVALVDGAVELVRRGLLAGLEAVLSRVALRDVGGRQIPHAAPAARAVRGQARVVLVLVRERLELGRARVRAQGRLGGRGVLDDRAARRDPAHARAAAVARDRVLEQQPERRRHRAHAEDVADEARLRRVAARGDEARVLLVAALVDPLDERVRRQLADQLDILRLARSARLHLRLGGAIRARRAREGQREHERADHLTRNAAAATSARGRVDFRDFFATCRLGLA